MQGKRTSVVPDRYWARWQVAVLLIVGLGLSTTVGTAWAQMAKKHRSDLVNRNGNRRQTD